MLYPCRPPGIPTVQVIDSSRHPWQRWDELQSLVDRLSERQVTSTWIETARVLVISGQVRDYVRSDTLCTWARELYFNSVKLIITCSDSAGVVLSTHEQARWDPHSLHDTHLAQDH